MGRIDIPNSKVTETKKLWVRCAPKPVSMLFGEWTLVFDPATGETHFLTELPALLLDAVNDEGSHARELVERCVGQEQHAFDLASQVTLALDFLEAAELVETEQ